MWWTLHITETICYSLFTMEFWCSLRYWAPGKMMATSWWICFTYDTIVKGCSWTSQGTTSWKSGPGLQKEVCYSHWTHSAWEGQWNNQLRWHPPIQGLRTLEFTLFLYNWVGCGVILGFDKFCVFMPVKCQLFFIVRIFVSFWY